MGGAAQLLIAGAVYANALQVAHSIEVLACSINKLRRMQYFRSPQASRDSMWLRWTIRTVLLCLTWSSVSSLAEIWKWGLM